MLKITGVILCIAGCTGYGLIKVANWNQAIREMEQWILLFEKIKSQIYYQRDMLEEICCQLHQEQYGIAGKYVAVIGKIAREERTKSFSESWREQMKEWEIQSCLPKTVKRMLIQFPNYVGEQDYELQMSYLNLFLDNLIKEKIILEKQIQEKKKPVLAVSLVSGMIISILLL